MTHQHGPHGHSHGSADAQSRGFVADPRALLPTRPELERGAGRGHVLFLDCQSGIAGDMTIAALLDLGVPRRVLEDTVEALGLGGVELVIERGYAGVIGASHFDVRVTSAQPPRTHSAIVALIERSPLPRSVRDLALSIFLRLAQAEAEVHRQSLADVEFHEVGSVDAIVDIIGAAALFDYLGATVIASPLPLGRGYVQCQHGHLPLPAPATLLCLAGVPTILSGLDVELVTPTGAAIVATVATRFVEWPAITSVRVGWGAGSRALADRPNALRAVLGREKFSEDSSHATHVVLEANIDDMTGEAAAFAVSRLLEAGALDAWLVPVIMKKGRPGLVVSALAPFALAATLADVLFRETTTIGVRQTPVGRHALERHEATLDTPYGPVRVKLSGSPPSCIKVEFEDCARIARETGRSLVRVGAELQRQAEERWAGDGWGSAG